MSQYRWRREYWLNRARHHFNLAQTLQNEFDTAFANVYQSNEAFFYMMNPTNTQRATIDPATLLPLRMLAGNSVRGATDMGMAVCLDPNYRIDGIKVCTRDHTTPNS